ncbi:MAG TPA: helix-turn-helix domain-containing protein [Thermoleophilaceae bacterium]|nr:helix-turn-helix domain-containing protein [Thermoleophilaceae bacterium]
MTGQSSDPSLDDLTETLIAAATDEHGLQRICESASALLGRPVLVLSTSRRIVAAGGVASDREASAILDRATRSAALVVDGSVWGGVSIAVGDSDDVRQLDAFVNRIARFIELELSRSGLPPPSRQNAPRQLLMDLLYDRLADPAAFLVRARALGFAFDDTTRFVALAVAGQEMSAAEVEAMLASTGAVALNGGLPTAFLVLAAVPRGQERNAYARLLADALPTAKGALHTPIVAIGSPARDTLDVGRALRTAQESLHAARSVGYRGIVVTSEEMAIERLLARLSDSRELARTVDEILEPLDFAAGSRGEALLTTLERLLERTSSKADTARALGIRRQSLYRRIERLEAVLGQLDDPNRRFTLQFALRARRLLAAQPSGRVPNPEP